MDRTVQQQPQAQAPMTTDAPQNKGEGNDAKQVTFGTARYNFYPSSGPSTSSPAQAGNSSGSKQPSIIKTQPLPALPQPAKLARANAGGESEQAGQKGTDGQDKSCLRGGATGNCCTEPFGCCYHWAKNICGDGTN